MAIRIKEVRVIDKGSVMKVNEAINETVKEFHEKGWLVELADPRLVIGAPPVGSYHLITTVIGKEVF